MKSDVIIIHGPSMCFCLLPLLRYREVCVYEVTHVHTLGVVDGFNQVLKRLLSPFLCPRTLPLTAIIHPHWAGCASFGSISTCVVRGFPRPKPNTTSVLHPQLHQSFLAPLYFYIRLIVHRAHAPNSLRGRQPASNNWSLHAPHASKFP